MTSVSTEHPYGLPYIELTGKGRKISFRKDCLEDVAILRKVNEGEWEKLVKNTRSPYVDEESFPTGTKLSYVIELNSGSNRRYEVEARL